MNEDDNRRELKYLHATGSLPSALVGCSVLDCNQTAHRLVKKAREGVRGQVWLCEWHTGWRDWMSRRAIREQWHLLRKLRDKLGTLSHKECHLDSNMEWQLGKCTRTVAQWKTTMEQSRSAHGTSSDDNDIVGMDG